MSAIADQIADLTLRRDGVLKRLTSMSQAEQNGDEGRRLERSLQAFETEIMALEDVQDEDDRAP